MNLKSILKKLLFVLTLFSILYTFNASFFVVRAITYNDDGTASYTYLETKSDNTGDYTSCKHEIGTTTYNGSTVNQSLFVFSQKQTENSKVVTWAVSEDNGKLKRANVATIAQDYELHHPDWKVIGAINADQYVTGFGENIGGLGKDYYYPQPYYPMICDSEGWFIMTGIPVSGGQNIAAFLQNGSNDPIINGSANIKYGDLRIDGIFLYILDDDGNRLEKFQVSAINETPYLNETTVWTSYYDSKQTVKDIDITGNLYVIKDAERVYASNSIDYQYKPNDAYNAFFGKGVITEVSNTATIGYGDFAIDTNDQNLIAALDVGKRVLVQYEIEGDFAKVESAIGFHTIQRYNDTDNRIESSNTYNTRRYPRAVVGRTATGEIVLVAVDGLQENIGASGANFWELNAILKSYGVVEAYQMDGGGSVTAVVKNENGGFSIINSPSDGSARANLSALLLVERRKPEAKLKVNNISEHEIIFDLDLDIHGYLLNDIVININNKDYKIDATKETYQLIVSGFSRDTEYDYKINIEYQKDNTIDTVEILDIIKVNKIPPKLENCNLRVENDKYIYEISIYDPDNAISTCFILIEGVKYYLVDGFIETPISTYVPYLQYSYNIGDKEQSQSIKYPHSKLLSLIDDSYWKINNQIDDILN